MIKGNLNSTIIVLINADRKVTQIICVFTPKRITFTLTKISHS
jgi:hypothetical protein